MTIQHFASCIALCTLTTTFARTAELNRAALEALKPFAAAVGAWSATIDAGKATPSKSKLECTWGFRESDGRVSLNFYFDGDAPFEAGLLTVDAKSKEFTFLAKDKLGKRLAFRGPLRDPSKPVLQLARESETESDGIDRLELTLAKGGDKILLTFAKRVSRSSYKSSVSVEAFREGTPHRDFENGPFCVVTGGPGRVAFMANGGTHYAACQATKELAQKDPTSWLKQSKN